MLWLALALGTIVAVILVAALTRPADFSIQRAVTITATPEAIFPHISDFKNWTAWSPWEGLDPHLSRKYSGADQGVGAIYSWKGNDKVGEGSMELVEATPPNRLLLKLDFLQPFEAHNHVELTLREVNGRCSVTWTMYGKNTFMGKLMSLFINMDQMLGKDFEKGLTTLKRVAENGTLTIARS